MIEDIFQIVLIWKLFVVIVDSMTCDYGKKADKISLKNLSGNDHSLGIVANHFDLGFWLNQSYYIVFLEESILDLS